MEKYTFSATTKMEAINEAKKQLEEIESNLIINEIENNDNNVIISVIEKREVLNFIKDYLYQLLANIGYNSVSIEITNKDITPLFTMYTENDSMLIGKGGKNLKALQNIVKEVVKKEIGESFKFILNINNYQEKRKKSLEYLAYSIAKEVRDSGVPVKMDKMNSYERRIVHSALANDRFVYTESEGEEPNRYLIVKPKEDK